MKFQKIENDWKTKQESIKTWTSDPCGAVYTKYPIGSMDFFDAIRNFRYNQASPWLSKEVDFGKYRNRKILEVGCGVGMDSASFAKAGAIVTGIDLTPRSIELATKQFEIYGLKGEFFVADAENLPFPEESFDIVYSFGVLHHTPNIRKAIDEIYRVLKPGGQVLIMLYNKDSVFFLWDIVFLERIIHGNLLRESIEDRLSRIEYTTSGAKPLVRVYTRKEARKLFCKFRNVNVKVFQLKKDDISIPFIEKLVKQAISDKLVYSLSRHLGWNLFIRGTK